MSIDLSRFLSRLSLLLCVSAIMGGNLNAWGGVLDIASNQTVELPPGKHVFESVRITGGVLKLSGDTEILVTGANTSETLIFSLQGERYQLAEINANPDPPANGATGINGINGADGKEAPGNGYHYDGPGGDGQDGTDAGDGQDGPNGTDGWRLKITVLGNARLDAAKILTLGSYAGSGGWGGNGGNGGGEGQGDPDGLCGAGGDAGNAGSGGQGGKGGRLWLTVLGDLSINETLIHAGGGRGGNGGRDGNPGSKGHPADGTFTDPVPPNGAYAHGGHGGGGGKGGEIHLYVGGNLISSSNKLYTYLYSEMNANGGSGGSGGNPRRADTCLAGAGGHGGTVDIYVQGQYQETFYPVHAWGGAGGVINMWAVNCVGEHGGHGGRIVCQAAQGILSTTDTLHFGAQGGQGSQNTGRPLDPPETRAMPGPGGDGGNITLAAPTIQTLPVTPGVAPGQGGRDYYFWTNPTFAPSGTTGTLALLYPSPVVPPVVLTPEIRVFDGPTPIQNGDGPISFGRADEPTTLTRTFTVQNMGTAPLRITTLRPPAGYTVDEGLDEYILAGGDKDTFTIRLSAAEPGLYQGTVHLEHNDPRANPFEFRIQAVLGKAGSGGVSSWMLSCAVKPQ